MDLSLDMISYFFYVDIISFVEIIVHILLKMAGNEAGFRKEK